MLAPRLLEGLRVLVVEDNLLLAEVTEILLEDSGREVVGPAGRLQRGLELARDEPLDGAILDINLHGEMSLPLPKCCARAACRSSSSPVTKTAASFRWRTARHPGSTSRCPTSV